MLWHMVEEFEHRRCASDIYEDVVGDHGLRLRSLPATWRHMREVSAIAVAGIRRYVPRSDNLVPHDDMTDRENLASSGVSRARPSGRNPDALHREP